MTDRAGRSMTDRAGRSMTDRAGRTMTDGAAGRVPDRARPAPPQVKSPCVSLCRIDPDSGFCEGCLRTLDEIAAWGSLPASEQRRILERLDARRAARPANAAR